MRRGLAILYFLFYSAVIYSQRNLGTFSPSPYYLREEVITANITTPETQNILRVSRIEVIDNRYDISKTGFYPIYKSPPKKLQLGNGLSNWFSTQLYNVFPNNVKEERDLLIIIQRFWFSNEADHRFSLFKQHLLTSLYYKLEFFSFANDRYYPLKRLEGNFRTIFNNHETYRVLADSLFLRIQRELSALNIQSKETADNALNSQVFEEYLVQKANRVPARSSLPRGVYATFDDFVQKKVLGDSVDLIKHYDYFGNNTVSCHIGLYKQGLLQSCNKYWGYYDGNTLFINTGTGLFVRLHPWNNHFVLTDLQQIAFKGRKKLLTHNMYVANSSYGNIKDFAKTYHLFYQLDFDEGKLF